MLDHLEFGTAKQHYKDKFPSQVLYELLSIICVKIIRSSVKPTG